MLHRVYTVYDSKAECYAHPFYMRADGEAIRAFRVSISRADHPFGMNPSDYTLFCIGTFDDASGRFYQDEHFTNLGNGVQHVNAAARVHSAEESEHG